MLTLMALFSNFIKGCNSYVISPIPTPTHTQITVLELGSVRIGTCEFNVFIIKRGFAHEITLQSLTCLDVAILQKKKFQVPVLVNGDYRRGTIHCPNLA